MMNPSGKREAENARLKYFLILAFTAIAVVILVIMPSAQLLSPKIRQKQQPFRTSIKLTSPSISEGNSSADDFTFALISTIDGLAMPWQSILRYGKFVLSNDPAKKFDIIWKDSVLHSSYLNNKHRALVFTDLIAYCGKLYSSDSATGVLYELSQRHLIPRQILMSGDGMNSESFQSSWTSIKNGILYIGSTGLLPSKSNVAWTPKSSWITIIDPSGRVNHVNWEKEYSALNNAAQSTVSLRHEAVLWSERQQIWIFLPTFEISSMNDWNTKNRSLASSLAIFIATSDFRSIDVRHFEHFDLPNYEPNPATHDTILQLNSAKFLPNSEDKVIVCLLNVKETSKSGSPKTTTSRSFLMMFTLNGLLYQPITEIPFPSNLISLPDPLLVSSTGIEFL